MQNTSTQIRNEETSMQNTVKRPKKATVEFLKQFARVYTFTPLVTASLGGFVAN